MHMRTVALVKVSAITAVIACLVAAPVPALASRGEPALDVLSSRADRVSGGDALVRVRVSQGVRLKVLRNGEDVTAGLQTGPRRRVRSAAW